jgi:hypothetical protein
VNQTLSSWQRIGWVAAIAIAVVLAGSLFVATWTPSVHEVHTPGATAMTKVSVDAANAPAFLYGTPTPTMSLADLRCQVSNNRSSEPCPDPTTLAQRFWPTVAQSPKTIYVGLPASCLPFGSASGLNVEYVGSSRLLLFHCVSARAWFVPPAPRMMGVMAAPTIILVSVPADAIPAGSLTLVQDDRVEHLLGDDSTQVVLGRVTIP